MKLEISQEKTGIKHCSDGIRFLGYDIFVRTKSYSKKYKVSDTYVSKRVGKGQIKLFAPQEKMRNFSKTKRWGDYDKMEALHRTELQNNSDIEIVLTYNAEMRGIAQSISGRLAASIVTPETGTLARTLARSLAELHHFSGMIGKYSIDAAGVEFGRAIFSVYRKNQAENILLS